MSLFFNDRINEQKEDSSKDTVTFTYPWIVTLLPPDQDTEIRYEDQFVINYKFSNGTCLMTLFNGAITLCYYNNLDFFLMWNFSCFISYNLFYDNDMRFLYYSSPRIKMVKQVENRDSFKTPDGFLAKFYEAFEQKKISRMIVFVELRFPAKHFFRPFETPGCHLTKTSIRTVIDEYPIDMGNDYRFAFLRESDYTIKCPDGEVPCRRAALNITSEFFNVHFKKSTGSEFVAEHSIDVVKPIIIYLHTHCFEMPKIYDFNFAKRLLEAIDFFKVGRSNLLEKVVHKALCCKFVNEYQDFDSILQWSSLASRHSLSDLHYMVMSVVADKYYFKWQQIFPENARNVQNPLFLDVFGSENRERVEWIFGRIDEVFNNSLVTNVILD